MSLVEVGEKILAERIRQHPLELLKAQGFQVNWHHEVIADALLNHNRTMIVTPPGSGKTTLASVAFPCWRIGHDPKHASFLDVSYNDPYARSILAACKKLMTQFPPYVRAFGKLKPDKPDKWSHQAIIVEGKDDVKTPSIEALGIRSGAIGRHPTDIILDDPIDQTIAFSPTLLREAKRWFWSELMTRLDPDSRITIILTRMRFNDLAADIMQDKSFKTILIEAVGKKGPYADKHRGKSYWLERWTMDELKLRMNNAYTWNSQYMGDPTGSGEDAPFKEEWLTYWITGVTDLSSRLYHLPDLTELTVSQAVDPAATDKTRSSNFVDLTVGSDRFGNVWILEYVCGHFDPAQQIDIIVDQARKWSPRKITVESNAYQISLARHLQRFFLPINPKPSISDKYARISSLATYFKNGSIRVSPEHKELISEYKQFPYGESEDILDALEMAVADLREEAPVDWAKLSKDEFGRFTFTPRGTLPK